MLHPFQCIEVIKSPTSPLESSGYLLAACGPKLISTCLTTGVIVSQWTADASSQAITKENENGERPAKKQKTTTPVASSPNVIKLAVSPNNQYAVAVTDDKCVRVFAAQGNGKISELSQRVMPKRPCAIQVLPDNATIICGDKFGDVYSLPLLPKERPPETAPTAETQQMEPAQQPAKTFKPSATNLTVHTQGNRRALEAQQKQQNLSAKTKEPLKFEHKLLLGHVSMLTDIAYATRVVDGKQRGYIITADRDEHIRISRGPPQSHVIEGYCLGHKKFVSKICPIPWTEFLVSGGGEESIIVWEWPSFKIRKKFPNFQILMGRPNLPVAVSGIWNVPAVFGPGGAVIDAVVVAFEKATSLCFIPVKAFRDHGSEIRTFCIKDFGAPILDISVARNVILISLDPKGTEKPRLQAVRLRGPELDGLEVVQCDETTRQLEKANGFEQEITDEKALDDLLYGIERLRKRAHQDEEEET